MQITFNNKLDNMTYKHYLQQPRQAIENNLVKKINPNPILLDFFNTFPQTVCRYTFLKNWGFHHVLNGEYCLL